MRRSGLDNMYMENAGKTNMDFYRRVGIVLRAVPEGRVVSYGRLPFSVAGQRIHVRLGYALRNDLSGPVPAHRWLTGRGI